MNFPIFHTKHNTQSQLQQIALDQGKVYEKAVDSRSETIEDFNEEIDFEDKKITF